jgi:hypothetical protein
MKRSWIFAILTRILASSPILIRYTKRHSDCILDAESLYLGFKESERRKGKSHPRKLRTKILWWKKCRIWQ